MHSVSSSGKIVYSESCLSLLYAMLSLILFFFYMDLSAVLAHIILREKLHVFGILGCALCVVGSTTIVLHAPQEQEIDSVLEVWNLATEPGALSELPNDSFYPPYSQFFFSNVGLVLLQHSCSMRALSSGLLCFLLSVLCPNTGRQT